MTTELGVGPDEDEEDDVDVALPLPRFDIPFYAVSVVPFLSPLCQQQELYAVGAREEV